VIRHHDEPHNSIHIGFINFDGILGRRQKGSKQYFTTYQDGENRKEVYSLILPSILLSPTYFLYRERQSKTQINKQI